MGSPNIWLLAVYPNWSGGTEGELEDLFGIGFHSSLYRDVVVGYSQERIHQKSGMVNDVPGAP